MNSRPASPEQLEREIVETRAAIDEKLEQLQRLAPRRAAQQAAAVLGAQGGAFARNLALTLRDNPVPVLLLGVGIAWLMIAARNGRYASDGYASEEHASDGAAMPDSGRPEPAAAPPTAAALAAAEANEQGTAAQAGRGAPTPGGRDEGGPERVAVRR